MTSRHTPNAAHASSYAFGEFVALMTLALAGLATCVALGWL